MNTGRFRLAVSPSASTAFFIFLLTLTGCGKVWVQISMHQQLPAQLSMQRVSFTNQSEDPQDMVIIGTTPYYVANGPTGQHVYEWNGSSVVQISNTSGGGNDAPIDLFTDGTNLYFGAEDADQNYHVYIYNGSSVTQLSNTAGAGKSDLGLFGVIMPTFNFMLWNGNLYFAARDSSGHVNVYEYNGSTVTQISNSGSQVIACQSLGCSSIVAAGTHLFWIDNINGVQAWNGTTQTSSGSVGFVAAWSGLAAMGSKVYFTDDNFGFGYMSSFDGTTYANVASTSHPTFIYPVGSNLYIFDGDGIKLWNGSTLTTISSSIYYATPVPVSGGVYFVNASSGHVDYVSGTTITQISNTSSGGNDKSSSLLVSGANLYFSAFDSSSYEHLYVYNGTTVTQISNTNPGGDDLTTVLGVSGSNVYFSAANSDGFTHLYTYNGSSVTKLSQPTQKLTGEDIYYSVPITINGKLYLDAITGENPYSYYNSWTNNDKFARDHLFSFDGTTLSQLSNTSGGITDEIGGNITPINNMPYFSAANPAGDFDLYDFDGTTVNRLTTSNFPEGISSPASLGSDVCFGAAPTTSSSHMYCWNGTTTTQITNTSGGGSDLVSYSIPNGNYVYFFNFGAKLYLVAQDSSFKNHLYSYNGTTLTQVSNTSSGGNDNVVELAAVGANLYFIANDSSAHSHVYLYNGSSVTQISNTSGGGNDNPNSLLASGANLYFVANDSSGNSHVYYYNGTAVTQISNIDSGGSDNPNNLTLSGTNLYFTANLTAGSYHVYYYNGSTVTQVSNTSGGTNDNPGSLVINGQTLYFVAADSTGTYHLYQSNGGTNTTEVGTLNLSTPSYSQFYVTAIGSNIYFQAFDSNSHLHLYSYDGGTVTQMSNFSPTGETVYAVFSYNSQIYAELTDDTGTALYEYK